MNAMNKRDARPLRIASLLPSATEIVCALGLESALIGVTHECDFPPQVSKLPHLTASRISHETMTSAEIDHAVKLQLHDGHGSIYDLDEKLLNELKPDLILTQELCDVCAVSYKTVEKAAARMFDAEAKVVSLEPTTIGEIFANVRTIGELTGTEDEAARLIENLTARLDALAAQTANLPRPRTLVLEWLEPPFKPGHWVAEQILFAGGDASFANAGQPSTQTSAEEINDYAPEVILIAPCGYYIADILEALKSAKLPRGWHELPAVKKNEVWAIDATSYFSRPAPRVVEGAEILARILHPEIFSAPTPAQAVRIPRELMRDEK